MATTDSEVQATRPAKRPNEFLRWLIVLSATFCTVSVSFNLWDWLGPPSWRPRIGFNAAEFDFGRKSVSDPVEHQIVLKNTGRQPLLITDVTADCSCVTVGVTENQIPPGYTLELPVRINLKNEKNGLLTRHLLIQSNDPVTPQLVMTLKGRVSGQVESTTK